MSQTIRTDWIGRWAQSIPDRPALEWDPTGQIVTYGQLHRLGEGLAVSLTQRYGLARGDRLAVLAQNTLEHVLLFVAAQKAGWVLVPMNFRLAAPEIAHVLADSTPSLIVAQRALMPLLGSPDAPVLPMEGEDGGLAGIISEINGLSGDLGPRREGPGFEDPIMILYTSGSTGKPKGALITHKMLAFNAVNTMLSVELTGRDVSFNAAPLYHTGGWNVLTTPLLYCGGRVILFGGFEADRLLALCEARGITLLWGVPTMLRMMADSPRFADTELGSVRYAIVGGEPMPEPLIDTWHDRGVPVRQGFGMTEVGPNCFSLSEGDALRKMGSIGRPNFYIDTRLVDEAGQDVGTGEVGELWMRGPVVTPGYWQNPQANAAAFHGDWFATGDLMTQDDEGYFRVVGRKKDMFISGGENVYPAEVERVLVGSDAIDQAAVVGAPDPRWGEVGVAFVVGSGVDAEGVRAHCLAHLAKYKVPKKVVFLESLPQGASGKIDKKALRRIAAELTGEGPA